LVFPEVERVQVAVHNGAVHFAMEPSRPLHRFMPTNVPLTKPRGVPVVIALEINLALWMMIACAAIRAAELISF
jgi:hypothetical protein